MRVTNGMLINNTLNGLYKNMNNMNKLYGQMTTGKKIQTVSDDPIIAGRSLKLKTTVLETTQYENNAKEAASWMEVTEAALDNMTNILKDIRTKCLQGANGSLSADDKNAIKTDIAQLYEQILQEANTTYSGRYVFSGYKTNEPLVLTSKMTLDADLTVTDNMTIPSGTTVAADSVVKKDSSLAAGTVLGTGTVVPGGTTLPAGTTLSADEARDLLGIDVTAAQYEVDADYTIPEGTELSKETADALGIDVTAVEDGQTYTVGKGGFAVSKGTKLDAAVAEEALGVKVSNESYTITADLTIAGDVTLKGNMTLGAGTKLGGDITLKGDSSLAGGTILAKDSVMKAGSTLPKGAFNPVVYGKIDGQEIAYEIGVNNTININTLGMDSTLSNIMASLEEMYGIVSGAVDGNVSDEDLYAAFNEKVGEMDEFLADISSKTADLGSRMARVDYVQTRLTDQKTTFKSLLSETEDIDIEEAYIDFNTQYATYQSALQATSKIITNTLADYL